MQFNYINFKEIKDENMPCVTSVFTVLQSQPYFHAMVSVTRKVEEKKLNIVQTWLLSRL